jgi:hypothetical protein
MSRRKLPLEDPNWWPIREALEHHYQQTGSARVTWNDFNQELKAGRLRALVRRDSRRELLAASAWDDFYVSPLFSLLPMPRMEVFSHSHKGKPPPGHWFYVWKPDYVRIFGAAAAAAEPRSQVAPPTEGREGKSKLGAPLKHDWIAITTEVAFREANATKKERDRSALAEANMVRVWCGRHLNKRPPISDLREIVAIVRGRFRQPE